MSNNDHCKVIRANAFRWNVPLREYKSEGSHFHGVTRQTLLGEGADEQNLNFITRYFEIQPGGYSTLEHHQHTHSVIIIRGAGEVILGERVEAIDLHDVVYIAPGQYHQFHALGDEPLGFLCIVDRERDRPNLPDTEDIKQLKAHEDVRQRMRT